MSRLQLAIDQIRFARDYTNRLLDAFDTDDWFRQPPGLETHVAWQVGHLTIAEFRLALERVRGSQPGDRDLIAEDYLRVFGKDSRPAPGADKYPAVEAIRRTFDRVHERACSELATLPDEELDRPILQPHALVKTKLRARLWCAQHELLHAGQIGMLRRLFGHPPLW